MSKNNDVDFQFKKFETLILQLKEDFGQHLEEVRSDYKHIKTKLHLYSDLGLEAHSNIINKQKLDYDILMDKISRIYSRLERIEARLVKLEPHPPQD